MPSATRKSPAAKASTPAVKASAPAAEPKVAAPAAAPKAPAAVVKAPAAPKAQAGKAPKAKPAAKPAVKAAAKPKVDAKAEAKPAKPKKPKLVRDSFTIPKPEYAVLEELKQRSTKLARPTKKSELLRAGIKALAALSDAAFLNALEAVPAIKTGRPKASA